ncbi:MAG: cation:proton antiporter [Actinomycetota bacterium]|nr:cation:proton antiporter [Actinomycetota bacterium]
MLALVAIMVILLAWGLVAGRLAKWSVTAPIAMVVAGTVLTAGANPVFTIDLDTASVERAVEVVLAVLLFVDATEVRGGMLGARPKLTLRLLLIALPLSLVVAVLVGAIVFPAENVWLLAVMATVVMPTDLAPAVAVVRDRRVPGWLRHLLNVESGYNDGAVAPIFLFCLAAAPTREGESPDLGALLSAVPALVGAVVVGVAVGWPAGWLLKRAYAWEWTQPSALRLAVLALPIIAYGLANVVNGNGFVAAFVAGILFAPATRHLPADALHFAEDTGTLLGLFIWFIFGRLITETLFDGTTIAIAVYALLVISVARVLPVMLSLVRTDVPRVDRLFLGWVGPRGLASIVFGLLAYINLPAPTNGLVGEVMVITVLASVVLHGLSYSPIVRAYGRRGQAQVDTTGARPG